MAKISSLKSALRGSVELEYIEGVFVELAPMPNPQFDAYMSAVKKPKLRQLRRGGVSGNDAQEMVKEAIAHTVVKSLRGLEDDDGTPVVYTSEWGLKTFQDPEFYDFYAWIRSEAADMANFAMENQEDAAKN